MAREPSVGDSVLRVTTRSASVVSTVRRGIVAAGRSGVRGFGIATSALRPDPDFLLIGAKRGGSTSFYYDLITHPQVAPLFPRPDHLPKAAATKGIHYFDSNYFRGRRWYASHLPSTRARRTQESSAGGPVITGEGSPYYLTHPEAPGRVARDLPKVKILAVLRDPVMRTHSHWKERVREGQESLSFTDALDAEQDRVGSDAGKLADPRFYSYAHEHQTYLGQSRYGSAVERWQQHVPAEAICLVRSEDYYADPVGELDRVAEFLGIRPGFFTSGKARNAAPGADLTDAERNQVQDLLRPDAQLLRNLTGISWDWV